MTQVVLVRAWADARAGGGCCGGEVSDPLGRAGDVPLATAVAAARLAETYRLLRRELPGADVQVVDARNTAWLLPATFRAVARRDGLRAAARAAVGATTAGSVLVDGRHVGLLEDLGPHGAVAAARAASPDGEAVG